MEPKKLSAIVAVARDGAIGKGGQLLCHLPADLRHFKNITMGHSIIMGRKTFESFPKGPLPGRQNIVVTRSDAFSPHGVTVAHSIEEAIKAAEMPGEVFVIGGAQLYAQTLDRCGILHLTRLHATFDGADAFFPHVSDEEWVTCESEEHRADEKNPVDYSFVTLKRKAPKH